MAGADNKLKYMDLLFNSEDRLNEEVKGDGSIPSVRKGLYRKREMPTKTKHVSA